jgi:bifunctional non-homologous end joining protein LigD
MGLEGLVAKRADAAHLPDDRSGTSIKVKCRKRQEFVIIGWTDPEKSRVGFGALLFGYYKGKDLLAASATTSATSS